MLIREPHREDLEAIRELSVQLGYDCSLTDLANRFEAIQEAPGDQLYVPEDASRVCGYIHLQVYRSLYSDCLLNIMGIVVDENCRGRGIGTALLEKAEEYARSQGATGIRALSGSHREKAHRFYIRNSFKYINEKKLFLK